MPLYFQISDFNEEWLRLLYSVVVHEVLQKVEYFRLYTDNFAFEGGYRPNVVGEIFDRPSVFNQVRSGCKLICVQLVSVCNSFIHLDLKAIGTYEVYEGFNVVS